MAYVIPERLVRGSPLQAALENVQRANALRRRFNLVKEQADSRGAHLNTLAVAVATEFVTNYRQQLMTKLAKIHGISTGGKDYAGIKTVNQDFLDLLAKVLNEKAGAVQDITKLKAEFIRVFLGPNATAQQIKELEKMLMEYQRSIIRQRQLREVIKGVNPNAALSLSVRNGKITIAVETIPIRARATESVYRKVIADWPRRIGGREKVPLLLKPRMVP